MTPHWEARRMEYGHGRWAAFHPLGYWAVPSRYGRKAAEAEARRRNLAGDV
jgi:hypothetical protein